MAKTKKLIPRDGLGEALHTALRKCCDSVATSILYNVISICDEAVWQTYLDFVWVELQVEQRTGKNYSNALRKASLGFDDSLYKTGPRDQKINGNQLNLLALCFEMMSDKDWSGYSSFIEY